MTRAVAIVVSCDYCSEPGQPHTITIDGLGPRDLDVCEVHAKESGLDDLRTAVLSMGRPAGRKTRKAQTLPRTVEPALAAKPVKAPHGAHTCPWCGKVGSDILSHARGAHGLPDRKSWPCPLDGRDFPAAQGLAMHSNRSHDMHWTALLIEARRQDDPHGAMADYDTGLADVVPWPW